MIERVLSNQLQRAAGQFPAVTLTGPRQSGKSTLCRSLFPAKPFVNLEDPDTRSFANEDPRSFLARFPDGAIIDEVHRAPELPSYLQGLIDANPSPGRWILTGSQNLALLQSVSQSLAGRSAVLHLLPLTYGEVVRFEKHPTTLDEALFAGSFPRVFDQRIDPSAWARSYVATYVERDLRTISNVGDLTTFQRFLALCAGRTGQLLNYSSLASDCGITQPTAKAWVSVLEKSYVVFRLPPFSANVRKRLVKMPKLHFYDTGLACWLMGIRSVDQLRTHPLRGAIFESWVVSEIVKHRTNAGESGGLAFYRDRDGVEADLVIEHLNGVTVVEAKAAATASSGLFEGSHDVRDQLAGAVSNIESIIVYGGDEGQERAGVTLLPWSSLHRRSWIGTT